MGVVASARLLREHVASWSQGMCYSLHFFAVMLPCLEDADHCLQQGLGEHLEGGLSPH